MVLHTHQSDTEPALERRMVLHAHRSDTKDGLERWMVLHAHRSDIEPALERRMVLQTHRSDIEPALERRMVLHAHRSDTKDGLERRMVLQWRPSGTALAGVQPSGGACADLCLIGANGTSHARARRLKRRAGTTVLIAAVSVLALCGATALWFRHTYGTLMPWQEAPSKLNVFGRDYRSAGDPDTREALAARYPNTCLDLIAPPPLRLPYLLPANPCGRQDVVPTNVWLQVGPDAFRGYSLSGGP